MNYRFEIYIKRNSKHITPYFSVWYNDLNKCINDCAIFIDYNIIKYIRHINKEIITAYNVEYIYPLIVSNEKIIKTSGLFADIQVSNIPQEYRLSDYKIIRYIKKKDTFTIKPYIIRSYMHPFDTAIDPTIPVGYMK